MKTKKSIKKMWGILLVVLLSVSIMGCFEGYVGSEGDDLRQYLPPAALLELTQNPDPNIWIIDVRSNAQYVLGHIPTAKSFPSGEIMSRLDELPLDQYLIIQCETGIRAQAVIRNLEGEGYTRFMNWGGIGRWPYALESGSGE